MTSEPQTGGRAAPADTTDVEAREGAARETPGTHPLVTYVFRIDAAGAPSFPHVSQACEHVYGFTATLAMADVRLMHDAIHPADRAAFVRAGETSLRTMQEVTWEGRILRTDGLERLVTITSRPLMTADGTIEWHGAVADLRSSPQPVAVRTARSGRQDTFGVIGQEIGAPLAAIVGYADWGLEILQRDGPKPGEGIEEVILRRCFEVIVRQGRRLGRIRDDLVVTANAQTSAVRATPELVNVARHLEKAAGLRLRDLDVAITCPAHLTCLVQPDHLDHVLANLVSNAERHARSKLRLAAAASGTRVRISVADDGPGVASDRVERLFFRFDHATEQPADGEGAGLGLYIVRTLVLANGGSVVYEPGRDGARFTVTLPRTDSTRRADAAT